MKRIMKSGTFKDKVSALSIYIQDNPRHTLKTLENMVEMCSQKGKKDTIIVFLALKDLFSKVYMQDKGIKMVAFQVGLQSVDSRDKKQLAQVYVGDQIKKQFKNFLEIGRRLLMDTLFFVKEAVTKAFLDILLTDGDQPQAEYILNLLINKLGDSDKKFVKTLMNQLGKLVGMRKQLQSKCMRELMGLVFRVNIDLHTQHYALNLLNAFRVQEDELQKEVLQFYFRLFSKIIKDDIDSLMSSKILSQILRGVNIIFPEIKNKKAGQEFFKAFFDKEVDSLYRLVHMSSNLKIRIQTLLFIYQVQSIHYQLNDRFYNLLYEMLHEPQVQSSSLQELFFDLLFFALKADFNINRLKGFVKRLLQVAISSTPGFMATSLIFVSNLVQVHKQLVTMFTFPEGQY